MPPFREGDAVRIRLLPDCADEDRSHDPSEDGAEGSITDVRPGDGHGVFVLFRTLVRRRAMGFPKPVLGATYRSDELEALDGEATG